MFYPGAGPFAKSRFVSRPNNRWIRSGTNGDATNGGKARVTRTSDFAGAKGGAELVNLLQEHKILVIPPRYDELLGRGFGGNRLRCVVVGSSGGGLPEAIGPCGVTFPNGNSEVLGSCLKDYCAHPRNGSAWSRMRRNTLKNFVLQS